MPQITVRTPSGASLTYRIDRASVLIGRSQENDLVLYDASVSRVHVEIRQEGTGWVVSDRGSRNGTMLNGSPLEGAARLVSGSEILVGDTVLLFEDAGPRAEASGRRPERSTQTHPVAVRPPAAAARAAASAPEVVGRSAAIQAVLATARQVAPHNAAVLITGENGTGKELVARHIHHLSPRCRAPFTVVNCPALPGSLMEAELFGVEKGVATGVDARLGRLETAAGGTLLLDEVGDMAPAGQAAILRFLEERTIERVGGRHAIPVDVRILAATNHDLKADMERGAFRRDLYHRLNTVCIELPPLRARREDIPLLVEHFLSRKGCVSHSLGAEAADLLTRHDFPGNVRELERIVERAVMLGRGNVILQRDLPEEIKARGGLDPDATLALNAGPLILRRIVENRGSFWDLVRDPYLRREISREVVQDILDRAYVEAGGSYRRIACLFHMDADYRKLLNFIHHHDFGKAGR